MYYNSYSNCHNWSYFLSKKLLNKAEFLNSIQGLSISKYKINDPKNESNIPKTPFKKKIIVDDSK